MNSKDYWSEREAESLKHYVTDEKEYDKRINSIYKDMLDSVQKEIDSFYGRYANKEGITITEAKKRVSKLDIAAYERKAKRYVKNKDFSPKANDEMLLYNLTMKVNRLEMLKANIGLELIKGHDELEKYMESILKGRTMDELERQAGILGKTVLNNEKKADAIVNASFHNAKFSDRIWLYQDLLRSDLDKLLQTGLIQGKNPRALAREVKAKFSTSTYNAERLMRTEMARVQTEAQKQSFKRNGFGKYEFIANSGCCDICAALDGKHFDVDKMMPGENAPPMHPHCVLPDMKIIAPDIEAITRSEYSGDVIEIGTANGARLTVTANHIMLTARGWVRAKNIVKGDKVIRYSGWAESVIKSNPTNNDSVPTIEKLFAALIKSSTVPTFRMPVTSEDFKGDVVPNSEVDVIFVNGELRNKLDSTSSKLISDVTLVGAAEGNKGILSVNCSLAKFLVGAGLVADGIMSGTDVASILLSGSITHHELISLRRPSDYNSRLFKTAIDNGAANSKFFSNGVLTDAGIIHINDSVNVKINPNTGECDSTSGKAAFNGAPSDTVNISDLLCAFPGVVSFDDVIFVSNKFYSGHVYDASSLSTLYICNGILSSNCRCSTAAWEDSDEYEAWLDYLGNGGSTEEWNRIKHKKLPESIEKTEKSDIMSSTNDLYHVTLDRRKVSDSGREICDQATYHKLTNTVIKKGGNIITADDEWMRYLNERGATAVTIGDSIIFRPDATTTEVVEEVYHFRQNRLGLNVQYSEKQRKVMNEIEAQEYLISVADKYHIPQAEREETKALLEMYINQMEDMKKNGEWNE